MAIVTAARGTGGQVTAAGVIVAGTGLAMAIGASRQEINLIPADLKAVFPAKAYLWPGRGSTHGC